MLRYFLVFFLILSPAYTHSSYWDEDDDGDFEYDESSISETPSQVMYGGMSLECNYGCGDASSNPSFGKISSILKSAIDKAFSYCSPLYLDWNYIENPFPFYPWQRKWPHKYAVYDWEKTKGFYLQENPRVEYSFDTYPQFLELTSALRKDVYFYHLGVNEQELKVSRAALSRLCQIKQEGKHEWIAFDERGQLRLYDWGRNSFTSKKIGTFIQDLKYQIESIDEKISNLFPIDYEKNKEIIEQAIRKIDDEFRSIFTQCLEQHQPEGIAFHGALEALIGQDHDEAMDQIRWLIDTAEKHTVQEQLLAKLYLLEGQVQLEYGLYAEAIIGLTTAIHKNPEMKEAYFERAAAYFELGQFEQAIEDYLASNMRPTYFETSTQVGLGIAAGIVVGAKDSTLEFIPTMLGTAQGLGAGIWALLKNPVATSQEFVNTATQCVEYIQSHSTYEVVQDMVPELKELLQNYEQLDDFQKGKLIGQVIGKYGMDILIAKQSIAFIKSYQNLKNANKTLTLDALASSGKTEIILAETEQRWSNLHIEKIRKGEVKIIADKQGKHIVGHKNYQQDVKKGENPSIFIHPDPQKLLTKYGGTGIKDIKSLETVVGNAGYKEIVDFNQLIGYSVERSTNKQMATNLGKIHYAKDGAHIVPYVKR